MNDERIIELYFARDEAALTETENVYGGYCMRIAKNILEAREDAEECVNDTYLKAWNSIPPTYPSSLRAFLGRITRNLSISRYRKNHAEKRGVPILLSELGDCIPEPMTSGGIDSERELLKVINSWLRGLSPDDRAIFVRRYFSGDEVKSLAEASGHTQNYISVRLFKLRKKLKEALESEGYEL